MSGMNRFGRASSGSRRSLSCYSNAFGPGGVHAAVASLPATGLDRLELALRPHDFGGLVIPESAIVTERADAATATAFVAELARQGLVVASANVGGASLLDEVGVSLTERRIAFARRWFDVDLVVTTAGQPGAGWERSRVVTSLQRLGDFAAGLGVVLAVETHKGPTQNATAMLALMSEVDRPSVGINFDTGNIAYYNEGANPLVELERVKDWVASVHLKDNRGRQGDWYFPALGDGGAVDFRGVREILDTVGFLGPYTIEIEGVGGEPEPGLDVRVDRVRRSVDHLIACGYVPTHGKLD